MKNNIEQYLKEKKVEQEKRGHDLAKEMFMNALEPEKIKNIFETKENTVSRFRKIIKFMETELDSDNKIIERAFQILSMYGVPKMRAITISNGIEVLVSRLNKEINLLKNELSLYRK